MLLLKLFFRVLFGMNFDSQLEILNVGSAESLIFENKNAIGNLKRFAVFGNKITAKFCDEYHGEHRG